MKLKLLGLLCLLTASVLTSTSLAREQVPPEAQAKTKIQATLHNNDVFFDSAGIQLLQFKLDVDEDGKEQYKITDGQPYEGVTTSVDPSKGEGTLTVKAGRQKNEKKTPVARWFREKLGRGYAIGLRDKNTLPKELNFALEGTLTFRYPDGFVISCDHV